MIKQPNTRQPSRMRGLQRRPPWRVGERQRGVALLVVLLMLALIAPVTADFQFNSKVDLQLALNARDELQAEYNALTALKVRGLLLRNAQRLQAGIAGLGAAFGMTPQQMPPITQLLDMVPVECGMLSAIIKQGGDSKIFADKGESGVALEGDCVATSRSEHSKIAINMLGNAVQGRQERVMRLLLGVLSDVKMERHFSEDDANGVHADTPLELVGAMADWIDADNNQFGNEVGDEERPYYRLKDSYRVKNAPFDSVAELQLVHGIDDELYEILKDQVSIYIDTTQIELPTATDSQILFGLCAALYPGLSCAAMMELQGFAQFLLTLQELRMLGMMGGALNVQMLSQLLMQFGLESMIDLTQVSQVFTDRAGSAWYTIEAQGKVGRARKQMRAVFQANEGQFYYFRVE